MLLVFDVQVIEYFPLFGLGEVGVVVLAVELAFPDVDFSVLLLDESDEVFILIDEVGVLGQQQFYLLLEVFQLLVAAYLEEQFFVDGHQFGLELTRLASPVVGLAGGRGVDGVALGRLLSCSGTGVSEIGVVGGSGVVWSLAQVADGTATHNLKINC